MRIRYTNALLWRGLDAEPELTAFDVADGRMSTPDPAAVLDGQIDLKSAFVMPAFRDGHCHPLFAGREHVGPDVTDAKSVSAIQLLISTYAAAHPEVFWIDGAAYDRSIEAEFHRTELDQAVSDRPVVLHGADHHTLWVNSKALELSGLFDNIPNVSAGSVDLDADGVPTGILREWEAMQMVMSKIPPLNLAQELDCLDWAQNELITAGVVEVQDAWIDRGMAEIYLESARLGRLKVTTNLAFRADPSSWLADFDYFDEMRAQVVALEHPRLRATAIKFFVDGVLGSSTASVVEPYVAGSAAHTHGEQVWSPEELHRAAKEATERGYQLHLHAIGDRAVRAALDVIELVSPKVNAVIAHTELISDQDVPRFAELNVVANFEPLWAREDGQLLSCVPQVGRARIDSMYRMRDLAETGALISFGSDWPVSSPDALAGVATAVNRSLPGGSSWTLEQALTVRESLNAYTNGVARQLSGSTHQGTLFDSQPAEFVVLSANPFELPKSQLFDLKVIQVNLV
jgi:predicted amidohydrolase YtcJ